jgi:hypothetical protein
VPTDIQSWWDGCVTNDGVVKQTTGPMSKQQHDNYSAARGTVVLDKNSHVVEQETLACQSYNVRFKFQYSKIV